MIAAARNSLTAVSNWRLMIWLAVRHLLNSYTGGSRVAFITTLLEPLVIVSGMYVIRGLLKTNMPNYGTSLFLFYASGFLPFYLFIRVSSRTRQARTRPSGVLPGLSPLDVFIATVLLNSLIWITMIVVIFCGMWLYGIDQARPASLVTCAIPIMLLIVLGAGIGMINNVIGRFLSFWNTFYAIFTRGLLFLSGVIIIVDFTPIWLREICIINPLSHGVEWFRLGVYGRYPHNSLDPAYLIEWALIALFIGVVVDRAAIRKLGER